jgi:hypothetical protein
MNHDPIAAEWRQEMNDVAALLDEYFNGRGHPKRVGFALLTYNFGEAGCVNYIGNGVRGDVLVALKELVARWEGRDSEPEGKQ